ncbi:putative bifunctional diguanylate cyclase/phosphodiesterase [Quadrisphaera setariae]|uniref:EAL domain-containing protein n=1 Tax=Quadrisphaera setariae TaxID=2593304 RepID=A0A5C8ZLI8_9ACTN|nr:EAL domain-containing protein [Quadrisphaera setariae]TXR58033.1 EAL domain-containing protein [Quadrisphaera setariae]
MTWRWSAVLAAVGSTAVLLTAAGGGVPPALYFGCYLLGIAAVLAGALRHRGAVRSGWVCIGLAQVLWLLGDVVHDAAYGLQALPAGALSPGTPAYVAGYVLLTAGLVVLGRSSGAEDWRAGALEGAIVSVAMALLVWVLVAGPQMETPGGGWQATFGYFVGDVVLVSQAVHLLSVSGWRSPSHLLGASATLVLLSCDALSVLAPGDGVWTTVLSFGAVASNQLWALAALHRSSSGPPAGAPRTSGISAGRLGALTGALVLPPTLLGVLVLTDTAPGWAAALPAWQATSIVAAGVLVSLLVGARVLEARRTAARALGEMAGLSRSLEHQATHDPLTGLANRASSGTRLAEALTAARGARRSLGLLFVDLDGFKAVNDTHGHRAGDEVLRTVAGRLRSCVRSGDVVGRLGGDEFVVVLVDVADESELLACAQRVVDHLGAPLSAGGQQVALGASVGVAFTADGSTAPEVLLHEADTAAYRAKAGGRGCAVLYDDALRREEQARTELEDDLRRAIAADQLELHYQPVVNLGGGLGATGGVEGFEALVRWDRPGHGPVPPSEFVPVAEASDLVCELGRWVLRTAARQQVAWARLRADGTAPIIGVNLAPRHLGRPSVVEDVASALRDAGADPRRFLVEVTETDVVDTAAAVEHLRRIRALGVGIAIDDFGTGYASIQHLRRLPCDHLKIDRSLVVSTEPGAAELLALAVSSGHAFGMLVLAEGVETPEHEAAVLAAGADLGQGWLWSRALPASQLDEVVLTRSTPRLRASSPGPGPLLPVGAARPEGAR